MKIGEVQRLIILIAIVAIPNLYAKYVISLNVLSSAIIPVPILSQFVLLDRICVAFSYEHTTFDLFVSQSGTCNFITIHITTINCKITSFLLDNRVVTGTGRGTRGQRVGGQTNDLLAALFQQLLGWCQFWWKYANLHTNIDRCYLSPTLPDLSDIF